MSTMPASSTNSSPRCPPPLVFDASILSHQAPIPTQFVWPEEDKPRPAEELVVPVVDLRGFLAGDPNATDETVRLVGGACAEHGFFQVVNHGVLPDLVADTHLAVDAFFSLPLDEKQRAKRRPGESCGYASSFTGRFSSKLPWKETLSFRYSASPGSPNMVSDYLVNVLGQGFQHTG